ncbi:MAG: lysophospholipid acyltransferase family protein [Bacteroidales bacterium]|nr:lysophospholipid acyltransferase family protein [Bacteroidales bacterium]
MKNRIQNILLAPLGWMLHLLAFMPWWWIWLNSDVLYFLIYHVVGYRRKVVHQNLVECFPEKSEEEIKRIEKQFYLNFTDYFFETIKMLHISEEEMKRRMVFTNPDYLNDSVCGGQNVMLYASHYFNWEWMTSASLCFNEEAASVKNPLFGQAYHPLENQWFDRFFLRLRSRFTQCVSSAEILRTMLKAKLDKRPMVLGFLSDQHPLPGHNGYICRFLNHPTAIINGTEAIARKLGMKVGYFHVRKIKRGYYECTFDHFCDNAAEQPKDAATAWYAQVLEQQIKDDPAGWLWTHKRWKRPVTLPEDQPQQQ